MKITSIYFAALVCLFASACSNEKPAVNQQSSSGILKHVSVTAPFGSSQIPTAAMDARTGTSYVVFYRSKGLINNIFFSKHSLGEDEWSEPVRVNSVDGDASPHIQAPAQVVVDTDGGIHVVWTNAIPIEGRRFPASNLFIASSWDGGKTFSEQREINSDANGLPTGHTFHNVTVAPDGRILVTWLDSRTSDLAKSLGEIPSTDPTVSGSEVWLAVSKDGGKTFEERKVAENTCQCCRTSVTVADDGRILMAWRHVFPDGSRDMAFSFSDDGGDTFSEPKRIHHDGWKVDGCPHSGPSLTTDAAGNIHAAWYTGATDGEGLYYAVAGRDGLFGEPIALVKGVSVSQVQLTRGSNDGVWLAWEEKPTNTVQFAFASEATGLTRITDHSLNGHSPALAASADGVMIVSQVDVSVQLLQASVTDPQKLAMLND